MRAVTVRLEPLAREKIVSFAEAVKTEIGGLMSIRREGTVLTINDAWTIPQEVSVGSVDFEPGHFEDHIKAQGWTNGRPMPHICMGIWHSHADASTFMSGTDENDLVRKYAMRGFLVNLVTNRRGEFTCQVDSMVGPEDGKPSDYVLVTVPNTLILVRHQDQALADAIAAEITANVKARPIVTQVRAPNGQFLGHQGYAGYDDDLDLDFYRGRNDKPASAKLLAPASIAGVWNYDKKRDTLDFVDPLGNVIKSIADGGRGKVTLYDDDGKVLMTSNSRTARPKGKDKGRGSRWWPVEL